MPDPDGFRSPPNTAVRGVPYAQRSPSPLAWHAHNDKPRNVTPLTTAVVAYASIADQFKST